MLHNFTSNPIIHASGLRSMHAVKMADWAPPIRDIQAVRDSWAGYLFKVTAYITQLNKAKISFQLKLSLPLLPEKSVLIHVLLSNLTDSFLFFFILFFMYFFELKKALNALNIFIWCVLLNFKYVDSALCPLWMVLW